MVMMLSMLFSAPAFFLLPAYEGAFAFFLAIAAGGLSGGAHSLIVVMAQDLIPMRKGFASGAILGFIFATGAIGSLAIGFISDQIGLALTFQIVALMIAVAGLLSLLLPRQAKSKPAVVGGSFRTLFMGEGPRVGVIPQHAQAALYLADAPAD